MIMILVCDFVLILLCYNILFWVYYVFGVDNIWVDLIFCLQIVDFRKVFLDVDLELIYVFEIFFLQKWLIC